MAVTGVEARITEALLWFATEAATALGLPASQPGVAFKPTLDAVTKVGKPYLAVSIQPSSSELFGTELDSDADHQGLLQISVFWPSAQGIVKPTQAAAQAAAAFAPGTKIDRNDIRIRIDRKPLVAGALVESDWTQIPITVRWRAFVPADA